MPIMKNSRIYTPINQQSTTKLQNEYRCALCSVSCPAKSHIIRHLAVTHDMLQQTTQREKFLYECPTCGTEFSDLPVFKRHLMKYQLRKYNCSICPKVYTGRDRLEKHCLIEHGITGPISYKCEDCVRTFTNLNCLWAHSVYHKPPQFACSDCDRTFFNKGSLSFHTKAIHQRAHWKSLIPSRNKLQCQYCPLKYATPKCLRIHMQNLHKHKDHKCPHCYGEFATVQDLNNHQLKEHSLYVEPDTKCKICFQVCKDRKGLVAHMRFHGNPTLSCRQCPMKFHTAGQLSRHVTHAHTVKYDMPLRTTSKEVSYACAVCCKSFSLKGNLRAHLKIHSSKVQICPVCYQSVNSDRTYREHMHRRHPQSKGTTHCDICNRSFLNHETYLQHRKYHEKPTFVCPDCPMRFYTKWCLSQHSQLHSRTANVSQIKQISYYTGIFGCSICYVKVPSVGLLIVHLNKHHFNTFSCSKCDYQCYAKFSIKRHLTRFH